MPLSLRGFISWKKLKRFAASRERRARAAERARGSPADEKDLEMKGKRGSVKSKSARRNCARASAVGVA